jgi:hypothetical protein
MSVVRGRFGGSTLRCRHGGCPATDRLGFHQEASYGVTPEFWEVLERRPIVPGRGSAAGRAALEGKIVHIPDVPADPEYTFVEGQKA